MLEERPFTMSQSYEVTSWAEAYLYFMLAGLGLGLILWSKLQVTFSTLRSEIEIYRQQANVLTEVDLKLRSRFSLHLP